MGTHKPLVRLFVLLSLLISAAALYSANSAVKQVDEKSFKSTVLQSKGVVLVEFYAPWCGHCKSLAPEWEKAANSLKGLVTVVAVDATNAQSLQQKYGVQGFPTIKVFGADKTKPTDYQGARTADAIVSEAISQVSRLVNNWGKGGKAKGGDKKTQDGGGAGAKPKKPAGGSGSKGGSEVVELTNDNFEQLVLNSSEPWFVEFFAPWCGHCKALEPEWASAAKELKDSGVKLGAVDATVHDALGSQYDVKGFPTIKIFVPGKKDKPEDYSGPRESGDIVSAALAVLERSGVDPSISQLTNADQLTEKCSGRKICVVATLPHIYDGGKDAREGYINTLIEAAKKVRNLVFAFMWTEAGAQEPLESALSLSGAPSVAAFRMDKGASAVHIGAFDAGHISKFLSGVLSGSIKVRPYGSLPTPATVSEWDGKDAVIEVEEEMSLEELFADGEL